MGLVAAARQCSPALEAIAGNGSEHAVFIPLDLSNRDAIVKSMQYIPETLKEKGLDIIINCAGVSSETHGKVGLI